MKLHKKGQMFEQLGGLATGVAALAILLVVAFLVMSQGKDQAASIECDNTTDVTGVATCGYAYNSTAALQGATDDIPTWVPLIVVAFIGTILLGLVALLRRR